MITSVSTLPAASPAEGPAPAGTGTLPADKKSASFQSIMGDVLNAEPVSDEGEVGMMELPVLNVDPAIVTPEGGIPLPLQPLVTPPAIAGAAGEQQQQMMPQLQLALMESEEAAPLSKGHDGGLLNLLQRALNKPAPAPVMTAPVLQADAASLQTAASAVLPALSPPPVYEAAVKSSTADVFQTQLQSVSTPGLISSATHEFTYQPAGVGLTSPLPAGQSAAPALPGIPAPLPIATPIQQPQWGADLGNRVMWMVKQDVQTADIKLNPPHLGPLEVRVSMANDGVSVTFSSHHATVRDALDAAMPRLRDMLMDNGLQLANANVTNKPFSEHQNPGQGQQQNTGFGDYQSSGEFDGDAGEGEAANAALVRLGLVDYYA